MAQINLFWKQSGNYDGFNVYRSEQNMNPISMPEPIAFSQTTHYSDLSVEPLRDYFYRVGVVRGDQESLSNEITVSTSLPWMPSVLLSKPNFWLDSGNVITASDKVLQMTDLSGHGHHFTQDTEAARPAIAPSGRVAFDGLEKTLFSISLGGAFSGAESPWFFIVYQRNSTVDSGSQTLLSLRHTASFECIDVFGAFDSKPTIKVLRDIYMDSRNYISLLNTIIDTELVMLYVSMNSSSLGIINMNETNINTGYTGSPGNLPSLSGPVVVGGQNTSGSGSNLTGEIACILGGSKAPSAAELQKLFGWAAHKYGLTSKLPANHPYKNLAPMI